MVFTVPIYNSHEIAPLFQLIGSDPVINSGGDALSGLTAPAGGTDGVLGLVSIIIIYIIIEEAFHV